MFVLSISELSEVGMVRIKITINSIDRLSVVNLKINGNSLKHPF